MGYQFKYKHYMYLCGYIKYYILIYYVYVPALLTLIYFTVLKFRIVINNKIHSHLLYI